MRSDATKKVLILGSKGMLGQELVRVFGADERYKVSAWDREEIDATNIRELSSKIGELQPEIIFNAIAYNAVDLCETSGEELAMAERLNVVLPGDLVTIAKGIDATLVHYSTDYVFGGESGRTTPYTETDIPAPMQRYGQTKADGEQAVLTAGGKVCIVRLSKLFGRPAISSGGKKSFFGMMLEIGRNREEVKAVDEERSCFTYAPDLAEASKALVEDGAVCGIYHLVNEGVVTWYEGLRELYRQAGLVTRLVPVAAADFPRPAARPDYSALDNTKRPRLRSYQEALTDFLEKE